MPSGGRQGVRRVRHPACTCGSPSLGPPASCRPSGAFVWNSHRTHRERVHRRCSPAGAKASAVSALRRAPTGPPRWDRRHPAGPAARSPGTHMRLTGSECADDAPRRAPKRPPCPPSGVHLRGPLAGSAGILPAQRRVRLEPTWASPAASAPTMPPGAHQSVRRVRPPACPCGSPGWECRHPAGPAARSPGTHMRLTGSECADDGPRRAPKRPRCPPSSVHLRVPPLGAPASCRPSGAFARNDHGTHRERLRRRCPPARTKASPVSALRRAPAGPPRWERRHPAGPAACSPGPDRRPPQPSTGCHPDPPGSVVGAHAPFGGAGAPPLVGALVVVCGGDRSGASIRNCRRRYTRAPPGFARRPPSPSIHAVREGRGGTMPEERLREGRRAPDNILK
jgi:hypothetical protein